MADQKTGRTLLSSLGATSGGVGGGGGGYGGCDCRRCGGGEVRGGAGEVDCRRDVGRQGITAADAMCHCAGRVVDVLEIDRAQETLSLKGGGARDEGWGGRDLKTEKGWIKAGERRCRRGWRGVWERGRRVRRWKRPPRAEPNPRGI